MEAVKKAIDFVLHPQKKRVYFFNEGSAGKDRIRNKPFLLSSHPLFACFSIPMFLLDDKQLLGNKGAGLCEIKRLHLPVPPGFIITTEVRLLFLHFSLVTRLL